MKILFQARQILQSDAGNPAKNLTKTWNKIFRLQPGNENLNMLLGAITGKVSISESDIYRYFTINLFSSVSLNESIIVFLR